MTNSTMQQKATNYKNSINEGGEGYNPYADAAQEEKIDNMVNKFKNEWTAEVTTSRRAAWNAKVKSTGAKTMADAKKLEQFFGWKHANLKKAILKMEAN